MTRKLTMPRLGMTMTEGTILHWLCQEGELVEKGEPVLEVMTDKVNIEVEAPFTGRLVRIVAHDGDTLPVGADLAFFEDAGAPVQAPVAASKSQPDTTAARSDPLALTFSPSSLTHIAVASTPAAKREAAVHGIDLQAVVESGVAPPVHRADVQAFVESMQQAAHASAEAQNGQQVIRATPLAQKLAREKQIDLAVVAQRKPGAKVTRADVEALLSSQEATLPAAKLQSDTATQGRGSRFAAAPTIALEEAQESELVPLSPVRRLIGQRMQQSIITAPHIYLDIEIDMSEAERWRQRVGRVLQQQGELSPSLTAILVRAAAAALVAHPEVNAAFAPGALQGKDAIRRWHAVHIGIAVDTEQALLTPVIRNAHLLTLPEIARELRRVVQKAREGKLVPEELANATFTISNLGMYGIDTFHAIIAPGQGAILAVGRVARRGVVIQDEKGERLDIRPTMKVSLSADHRVLDGASGSRFLQRLKALLEEPYLLL
jgi:pyruvate dehydrogenase E2 component (dihydrolipoamide acetyltransferase)